MVDLQIMEAVQSNAAMMQCAKEQSQASRMLAGHDVSLHSASTQTLMQRGL